MSKAPKDPSEKPQDASAAAPELASNPPVLPESSTAPAGAVRLVPVRVLADRWELDGALHARGAELATDPHTAELAAGRGFVELL